MVLPYSASYGAWSVVTAVVLGILLILKLFTGKDKNLPPGPRGFPIIGSLHLLGKHPHQDLAKLAETYGPVMSLWIGSKLTVVASSPAAAEEILRTQGPNFSSRPKTHYSEALLPGDITTTSDSPVRLHLKKIFTMQLSTTKQVQETANVRTEEIAHLLRVMPHDGATVVPVRTYIEVVITNIISRMVIKRRFLEATGEKDADLELEQVRNFKEIADAVAKLVVQINLGDFMPIYRWLDIQGSQNKILKLKKRMDEFMSKIIAEHLAERKSDVTYENDMAHLLLDQIADSSLRFEVTKENVRGALWDAFIASTSTTTDTIEWALAECIHNPHVMKKAQAELDVVVGKARRVEDADIPNLKYLQAIVKENYRLHPVAPLLIPHLNANACNVFGYDIPAGTTVFVNVGAITRDPSIWKDPLEFKPERFMDGTPHADMDANGRYFELLPFGSGRRGCPGIVLGNAMVNILLATLLQSFEWSLPNGVQPEDLDMTEGAGVMSMRADPLKAITKARL